jgi:hypothetical protein
VLAFSDGHKQLVVQYSPFSESKACPCHCGVAKWSVQNDRPSMLTIAESVTALSATKRISP